MTESQIISDKQTAYRALVEKRKNYLFPPDLINPATIEGIDDEHLNAWAYWHNNLDADIMLIGQDFGDENYYKKYRGKDDPGNGTNVNLELLFEELGITIGKSNSPNKDAKLYFTNAVLGAKQGGMAAAIKRSWYSKTASDFTRPLIELISPKVIIAMGSSAYDVVAIAYGIPRKPMKEAISTGPIMLPNGKKLFVVYHCSSLGIANRNFEKQKEDWRKIKEYLLDDE